MKSSGTLLGDGRVTSSPRAPPRRSSNGTSNGSPGSSQPYRDSPKTGGSSTHALTVLSQAQGSSRSARDQPAVQLQHEVELRHQPVEAFRRYVDYGLGEHEHKGINGHGEEKVFVCRRALEEYWTHERIGAVLDRDRNTDANVEDIRTNFLEVFSILCYINHSVYINHFITREIDDKRLLASPARQRGPSDDAGFFRACSEAYKAQWKFKPLTFDTIVHRRELPMERILPIVYETPLSGPISDDSEAVVYKVSVHPCCMDPDMRSIANSNELVFKMFNPGHIDDLDLWQNEINAYNVIVNSPGGSLLPGTSNRFPSTAIASSAFNYVVKYLGSFIRTREIDTANNDENPHLYHGDDNKAIERNDLRGRTQIIMLEYAPGGSLADFCEQHIDLIKSPAKSKRLDFWCHMFHLLQALAVVHNLGGTHQDIRPSNILYMRKDGTLGSRERPCFKLADFGRSHFKRVTGSATDSEDTNNAGFGTYMAPECCGANEVEQAIPRPYTKAADIWALGCLYSEMLVRSSLGSDGVRKYREARCSENETESTVMRGLAEQCFHDGTKRLACVEEFHQKALAACPGDEVLQAVSDIILTKMLLPEAERAKDAAGIRSEWLNKLKIARGGTARPPSFPPSVDPESLRCQRDLRQQARPQTNRFPPPLPPPACSEQNAGRSVVATVSQVASHIHRCQSTKLWWQIRKRHVRCEESIKLDFPDVDKELSVVSGRRHHILVDDSESMRSFQNEAAETVWVLTRLLKRRVASPNEVKLSMLSQKKVHTLRKCSELAEIIRKHTFSGAASWLLGYWLHKVANPIVDSLHRCNRPVSLYILTDGGFGADLPDFATPISELLKQLRDTLSLTLMPTSLAITIVHFRKGNNGGVPTAEDNALRDIQQRVARSLSGLQLPSSFNPIYICRADGNVVDMLVGKIRESSTTPTVAALPLG